VGQEYEFSINITLKAQQTRASHLGSTKLGINSWCQGRLGHLNQSDPIVVFKKAC
jgi:type VI secretion system protein ImpH